MTDINHKKELLPQKSHYTIESNIANDLVFNDAMMADDIADSEILLADSMNIQSENVADCMVNREDSMNIQSENVADCMVNREDSMTIQSENVSDCMVESMASTEYSPMDDSRNTKKCPNFLYIKELQQKYNIGRASLYKRMEYLQIKSWKVLGKACLDVEQVQQMDGLQEYIKSTKCMQGYPIPASSGPNCENRQTVEETFFVHSGATLTECSIEVSDSDPLNTMRNSLPDGKRQHSNSSTTEGATSLIKNAQNKATGVLIAENMLAQQFIQNPETLPPELKEKIKQSAKMPEIDPFVYANALMSLAQNSVGFPSLIG
jgi:hypothetical protein